MSALLVTDDCLRVWIEISYFLATLFRGNVYQQQHVIVVLWSLLWNVFLSVKKTLCWEQHWKLFLELDQDSEGERTLLQLSQQVLGKVKNKSCWKKLALVIWENFFIPGTASCSRNLFTICVVLKNFPSYQIHNWNSNRFSIPMVSTDLCFKRVL